MNGLLLRKLKKWRTITAEREGVELFRILSNKTLDELSEKMPRTVAEMLTTNGIKEKKFQRYGHEILTIIKEICDEEVSRDILDRETDSQSIDINIEKVALSVSHFLDAVNDSFLRHSARVQGEVSSVDIRGSYLFFVLKDKADGSTINCFMWARDYAISGVKLEEGLEVIISGIPEIYKPTGRFTLRATSVELVGEGVLKNAYDKLKKQLEKEGIFSEENKRPMPEYPHTIGVITSKTGAVIHDFLNNLGKYGYHIKFFHSRVEGQIAVRDILSGLKYFETQNIDVLVIIRGGGSLESLQAFNNETIVRKVGLYPVPVICGIGHDKDVPLVSLAADRLVSTPTAVTVVLNESWYQASKSIALLEQSLLSHFSNQLHTVRNIFNTNIYTIEHFMHRVLNKFSLYTRVLSVKVHELLYTVQKQKQIINQSAKYFVFQMENNIYNKNDYVRHSEQIMKNADPKRMLRLGYSITRSGKKIVRKTKDVISGQEIEVVLIDGSITSVVKDIIHRK